MQEPLVYPETAREDIRETIHGVDIADPYRWLEDAGDERVQAWMSAQDEVARAYLDDVPARAGLVERFRELSYYDAPSPPARRGDRYFYMRRHADREKAILYWREGEQGEERVLIDPNLLSADGSVALGGFWPSRDGSRLAYKLNPNNADAAIMYVMDVATGATSTVDVIEGAKYASASWTPEGEGFYYTRLPADPAIPVPELPGHAHVRYHALGTSPDQDPVVFPATGDPRSFVDGQVSRDGRFLLITISHGWNATDVYFKRLELERPARGPHDHAGHAGHAAAGDAPAWQRYGFQPLVAGIPALFYAWPWQGSFYVLTNHDAPRYRVLVADPDHPGRDQWRELVPEGPAVIDEFRIVGNHLVLGYLENACSRMEVRSPDGALVREVALPGIGSVSGMIGNEDEDEAYYLFTSYTEPSQIYRTSIRDGGSTLWARVDVPVDTASFVVEQLWYSSQDGTRVSMFLIRGKDARPDGNNPTILYGYGGFNVSLTPAFSPNIVTWLERGGIYAIANLRGGGEYGEDWHKAGMLLNKQNTFDDFAGAARHLIACGWTSPARLAISGGSNGGLLVGATMTQEPALCAAVICAVPLLDMVRYHLFGSGKTWISEYGSADDPVQLRVLHGYSPYHNVEQGVRYPALLMLAADSDDRVDPMHARKLVAAVQQATASHAPVLLRIERNAGHGGADMIHQQVERSADTLGFLMQVLGMEARVR